MVKEYIMGDLKFIQCFLIFALEGCLRIDFLHLCLKLAVGVFGGTQAVCRDEIFENWLIVFLYQMLNHVSLVEVGMSLFRFFVPGQCMSKLSVLRHFWISLVEDY